MLQNDDDSDVGVGAASARKKSDAADAQVLIMDDT